MDSKKYVLYSTAKKTAKENNLILHHDYRFDNTYLFDFSLLDKMELSAEEKKVMMDYSIQHITAGQDNVFYGDEIDNFTRFHGEVKFNVHRVYSQKTWKRKYCILELTYVKHYIGERESIYRPYTYIEQELNSNTQAPLCDLEIA